MDGEKYVFAGNRSYVLERMIKLNLDIVKIWTVKNSYLQSYLEQKNMTYSLIENKKQLVDEIEQSDFDYFVSNGLPIILPMSTLQNDTKHFINIHPSLLPDLRGRDPIPGAILYQRNAGVTCHYMDDGIDSGDIISQIEIGNTENMDAGLLYQLSFVAEAYVFEKAYNRKFLPLKKQILEGNEIYYSFKPEDLVIDLNRDEPNDIVAKVNAFSTRNKGAIFELEGNRYKCFKAEIINNNYCQSILERYNDLQSVFQYEDVIVLKVKGKLMKFTVINSNL